MIKSVLNSSYDFGEQSAHLIGVTSRGLDNTHLRKSASSSVSLFKDIDVKPEKGKSVVHVVAMGSSPYYPANKNGDVFFDTDRTVELHADGSPVKLKLGLEDTHLTFETDAKVYKEHLNGKDDHVYGEVLKSRFNPDLKRVELLLSLPTDEWVHELHGLEHGKDFGLSMSCFLPFDICNVCGNKASKREEYCDHLKHDLGQITSDGFHIAAINDAVTFFDISGVESPADRIAFSLLKAASSGVSKNTIGGAELAEKLNIPTSMLTYHSKFASTLKKLAEMEKTIEAVASADDPVNSAACINDLPDDELNALTSSGLNSEQILGALASAKVVLSLGDFMRVLMGPQVDEVEGLLPGAEALLPGVFSRMCVNPKVQDGVINIPDVNVPCKLKGVVERAAESNGLSDDDLRSRVTMAVIEGKKPKQVKEASVKEAAPAEEMIAQLYGQYKSAFCCKHLYNNGLTFNSVLSHYIHS
jgi:hypothetical protein